MSHPVRVRALAMLEDRQASPNELSRWLGTSLSSTAYHVRVLHKLGLIELVDETRVRGAVEHHYRARPRPKPTAETWSAASPIAKQAQIGARLTALQEHAATSAAAGGFDRPEALAERKPARLDEAGWRALESEVTKFLERIARIEVSAATRAAKSGEDDLIAAAVVVMTFESVTLSSQIPRRSTERAQRSRQQASRR